MNEHVRQFVIYQQVNGALYSSRIHAPSLEAAEVLAARIDAWVMGEPAAEYCGNCGCELVRGCDDDNNTAKGH